jgi:hypothetical protein
VSDSCETWAPPSYISSIIGVVMKLKDLTMPVSILTVVPGQVIVEGAKRTEVGRLSTTLAPSGVLTSTVSTAGTTTLR